MDQNNDRIYCVNSVILSQTMYKYVLLTEEQGNLWY